jgi:hypothetical protein
MTLSRIGACASLSFIIFAVWLGACGGDATETCGNSGLFNGTCEWIGDGGDSCGSGSVLINTTDSPATGCADGYHCCGPAGTDSGAAPAPGTGSGSGS